MFNFCNSYIFLFVFCVLILLLLCVHQFVMFLVLAQQLNKQKCLKKTTTTTIIIINDTIRGPKNIPTLLTSWITFILSKGKDIRDPKNYRPITCLPTIYNILTAALTNRIYNHLLRNSILPEEKKMCFRMSRGCKDQLLVSKMITSLAKKHQRHLCRAWTCYKKEWKT